MRGSGGDVDDAAPFERADVERWRAARERGLPPEAAFETLMAGLSDAARARFALLAKESRGAWCALYSRGGGATLFVGNALSGAAVALGMRARLLVLCDPSLERLSLARTRLASLLPGTKVFAVVGGAARALPFARASFDLAVHEGEPAGSERAAELARVSRGEIALRARAADVPLAELGFRSVRAFALHPSAADPAQLASLNGSAPRRHAGASRARALLVRVAEASGVAARRARARALVAEREVAGCAPRGVDAALVALARILDEPLPEARHVLASCGNTCEVLTAPRARGARGRWRLHLALRPDHVPGLERAQRVLERIRADRLALPVPEPLFAGEVGGLWLTCERSTPGFASDVLPRDFALADRIAAQAAEHLAALRVRDAATMRAAELEREVEPWFERALADTADRSARGALEELQRRARAALADLELPPVLVHGDLRAKHVHATRKGAVTAYVHWGVALDASLPFLDLAHLLVHARVRGAGESVGTAWRALVAGDALRAGEMHALEGYASRLALPPDAIRAVALCYPAFVATVGFQYSSHAPPDWLARQFELGAGPLPSA